MIVFSICAHLDWSLLFQNLSDGVSRRGRTLEEGRKGVRVREEENKRSIAAGCHLQQSAVVTQEISAAKR